MTWIIIGIVVYAIIMLFFLGAISELYRQNRNEPRGFRVRFSLFVLALFWPISLVMAMGMASADKHMKEKNHERHDTR